jgi:hypothetical protein
MEPVKSRTADPRAGAVRRGRRRHMATFVVGLFGLGLQAWISATHAPAYDGHVFLTPVRLFNLVSFFTIWSNILVTTIAGLLSRDPSRRGPVFTVLHLDSLVMITVTGLVYAVILARSGTPPAGPRSLTRHCTTPSPSWPSSPT